MIIILYYLYYCNEKVRAQVHSSLVFYLILSYLILSHLLKEHLIQIGQVSATFTYLYILFYLIASCSILYSSLPFILLFQCNMWLLTRIQAQLQDTESVDQDLSEWQHHHPP